MSVSNLSGPPRDDRQGDPFKRSDPVIFSVRFFTYFLYIYLLFFSIGSKVNPFNTVLLLLLLYYIFFFSRQYRMLLLSVRVFTGGMRQEAWTDDDRIILNSIFIFSFYEYPSTFFLLFIYLFFFLVRIDFKRRYGTRLIIDFNNRFGLFGRPSKLLYFFEIKIVLVS